MRVRRQLINDGSHRSNLFFPTKKYILLCNTAQTVCEIKGCEPDRLCNQQTAG